MSIGPDPQTPTNLLGLGSQTKVKRLPCRLQYVFRDTCPILYIGSYALAVSYSLSSKNPRDYSTKARGSFTLHTVACSNPGRATARVERLALDGVDREGELSRNRIY